jgi:hypothetical protein
MRSYKTKQNIALTKYTEGFAEDTPRSSFRSQDLKKRTHLRNVLLPRNSSGSQMVKWISSLGRSWLA